MLLYKPNSRNYASTAILLAMAWSSVAQCRIIFEVSYEHFGTVPIHTDSSELVPKSAKCLMDTSALVPKCLGSEVSWV